jgi:cytochrome c oxidase cbb3-type subunit 3
MADETNNKAEESHDGHGSHEYDGIKELNNPAPYWIYLLFIGTIGFSLFYLIEYFGYPGNGKDQKSEYKQVLANAAIEKENKKNASSNKNVVVDEKQIIAAGAKLFLEKGCIACHGMKGEGNAIGPNLTDNNWINGCKESDLIKIITNGKPEKGMTSFKSSMTDEQIKDVSNYILKSLVGSKPANAKAAQGVECK